MSVQIALPVDLSTPEQLSSVIMELGSYLGNLRDSAVRSKGASAEMPPVSDLLAELLQACKVDPNDAASLDDLRRQLDSLLPKAPVVHLTLAAMPGRTLRRRLTLWFRTEISPLTLLTFAVRSDLGGGVICQAGSHVYDYSFRRHILDNKQKLSELAFGV